MKKQQMHRSCFQLNNRLNAPLNLKKNNWTLLYAFSLEIRVHPFKLLKSAKGGGGGVGVYFGPPCNGFALHCHFVYLVIPGTPPFLRESKSCSFHLNANAKSEIHICSNNHETCLVLAYQ